MKNKSLAVRIATLNLPVATPAPGTVGSLFVCAILLGFYYLNFKFSFSFFILIMFLVSAGSWLVIQEALKYFQHPDPGLICLDEVVGMLVTLCFVPLTGMTIILGLILFRVFDILKPLGIKKVEQLSGPWGVLFDDVLAGVYANIVLQLILCGLK